MASSSNNNEQTQCVQNCTQLSEHVSISTTSSPAHSKYVESGDLHQLPAVRAFIVLILWYLFSFGAIFLNKYIVDMLQAEICVFSAVHFLCAASMGFVNVYWVCNPLTPSVCSIQHETNKDLFSRPFIFLRVMALLGLTRFLVIFLSLLSLRYVAVSFMETVKSSAPLFTVGISYCILKDKNGRLVLISLIPIVLGLVLCTMYEIQFVMAGFMAAAGANVAECLQFVLSKVSLSASGEQNRASPAELQFYTCFSAFLCHLPVGLFVIDYDKLTQLTLETFLLMVVNGLLYHFQTMMAWYLMQYLSPLTHSVLNTVKCALAMWLSILLFSNPVTFLGSLGSIVVVGGVLLYNKARDYERLHSSLISNSSISHQLAVADDLPAL